MHRQIHRIRSLFTTLAFMASISCMQAEKVSLDTSGAQGLLLGSLSFELGLFGGGSGGYSGAQFVAVGNNGNARYSYDGITWHSTTYPYVSATTSSIRSVFFNGSLWVAAGEKGTAGAQCALWSSSDGITWEENPCPPGSYPLYSVSYGGGRFVAGGQCKGSDGDNCGTIIFSTNGINWTMPPSDLTTRSTADAIKSIYFNKSAAMFIIVHTSPVGIGNSYPRSAEGLNWTNTTINANGLLGAYQKLSGGRTGEILAADVNSGSTNSAGSLSTDNGGTWSAVQTFQSASYAPPVLLTYGNGLYIEIQNNCQVGSSSTFSGLPDVSSGAYTAFAGCSSVGAAGFHGSLQRFVLTNPTGTVFAYSDSGPAGTWTTGTCNSCGSMTVNAIAAAR